MNYTPPPQYDASFASNLQNENQRLQQENAHLQQTIDNLRHDNRELKRMLDIAMNRESEWDTLIEELCK
jgi:cell shape-determining protein MreC